MKLLAYLKDALGMSGSEFMREWRTLTDKEKDWFKNAARQDAEASGIEIEN